MVIYPVRSDSFHRPNAATDSVALPGPLALEPNYSIINHVDTNDYLHSLALGCSAFQHEAQRCLFHEVVVDATSFGKVRLSPSYCAIEIARLTRYNGEAGAIHDCGERGAIN